MLFRWRVPVKLVTYSIILLRIGLALLIGGGLPPAVWAQSEQPAAEQLATVSDRLQAQLDATSGPISFLAILREQTNAAAFLSQDQIRAASVTDQRTALYHQLTTTALRSQAPLRLWLDAHGVHYRSFYLVNMLEVYGDASVVAALRQRPEINRLVANPAVQAQLAVEPTRPLWVRTLLAPPQPAASSLPYGLTYTHAPEVWAQGYTGQGIVVASQDTGVEWDHPALELKYRGVTTTTNPISNSVVISVNHVYSWYDYWGTQGRPARCATDLQVPCDDSGHGTHTVGTMLGDGTADGESVLGMAPDARWIGCRNMHSGVGTPASYTACFEFFLAPYPQGGDPLKDGKPELAPHLINNSWGCPTSEGCDFDSLRQIVETMRAAGIMVVASAGNSGRNGCSTVETPIGLYDAVFTVGAHDSTGLIADFSSRGPVRADGSNRLKPDLSAPGVFVRSAYAGHNYIELSGTSMASPHVAGAVALLWSAVPTLTGQISLTEQILSKSATPTPDGQCDAGGAGISPNNVYGYGQLNILAAVQMAQKAGTVTVTVLDPQGAPGKGVHVRLIDGLTQYHYDGDTSTNGTVQFTNIYSGTYAVQASTSNYQNTFELVLGAGENTQVEYRLTPVALPEETEPKPPLNQVGPKLFLPQVLQ